MSYQFLFGAYSAYVKRLSAVFAFGSMLLLTACGGGGGGSAGTNNDPTVSFTCTTTSDTSNTLYSFADFTKVLESCGPPQYLNYTYFAGNSYHMDSSTGVYTFDIPATVPTASSPATGTYADSTSGSNMAFTWYIEKLVDQYFVNSSAVVIQGTDTSTGIATRITIAVNNVVSGTPGSVGATADIRAYVEQSNYATENPMVRGSGTDGRIEDHTMTQDTSGAVTPLTCPLNSALNFSFADYERGLGLCDSAITFDYTWFAGRSFTDAMNQNYAFDAVSSAPTKASPATGTDYAGNIITWYVENAGDHSYLVVERTDANAISSANAYRTTYAITGVTGTPGNDGVVYTTKDYYEYSRSQGDALVRATDTQGLVYTDSLTQTAGGTTGTPALTCNTASTYDPTTDIPLTYFTFADYETVVNDCGTAMTFDHTLFDGKIFDVAGTLMTFNADGTGTTDDPNVNSFTWTVETATGGYSYLVTNYSCTAPTKCGSTTFRDTIAFIGVTGTPGVAGATYDTRKYSEASNYPTNPAPDMVRATGQDATIDNADQLVLQ